MFMMRYIHHSCPTVCGWQRHCRGVVAFFREIWKGRNRFYSLLLFFCALPGQVFHFYVFFFIPRFLFPPFSSRMDWLLKSLTFLSAFLSFPLLLFFWFDGVRWRWRWRWSINRHI
ncbi:hypothetical protein GGI43DRAFT_129556 [Trichoderma evansii]